jgi:hypothetical protein
MKKNKKIIEDGLKNEKMKKWKILLKMNNSKFKKMKNWKNEKFN